MTMSGPWIIPRAAIFPAYCQVLVDNAEQAAKATADNWRGTGFYFDRSAIAASRPFPAPSVSTTSATQAYTDVLNNAGAHLPQRDSVDERIVLDVRAGTGRIIQSPKDIPACCKPISNAKST